MDPSINELRSAVEWACQPTNAHNIVRGRREVLGLPRAWVLEHIEGVAASTLDLSDYWEYRRLLELAELLDPRWLRRLVAFGAKSSDPEIREAALDFQRSIENAAQ